MTGAESFSQVKVVVPSVLRGAMTVAVGRYVPLLMKSGQFPEAKLIVYTALTPSLEGFVTLETKLFVLAITDGVPAEGSPKLIRATQVLFSRICL
jgi:hypothetical protein